MRDKIIRGLFKYFADIDNNEEYIGYLNDLQTTSVYFDGDLDFEAIADTILKELEGEQPIPETPKL